ncbi:aspartate/glutamate racemase family protein [Paenibacillus yanchengensis]|uniref:Aspartate/glutamate racemase family protein n=1 Tax=Paenibacillus yanchengensis TaxID=2035833 RepID=A0ABW4YND0_9BACL
MKTIGLIGGMSWESTVTYYQIINQVVAEKLGGLHSAKCILYSVNFAEIEQLQRNNQWAESAAVLGEAAKKLEVAGADLIVICTNTMHKVADMIQAHITIPLLHIADATIEKLTKQQVSSVALLGTKYTMTQDFYKSKIIDQGIAVHIPEAADIEIINTIIFHELCRGHVLDESREQYKRVIESLVAKGAQAIILGCTEIGMLIKQADVAIPIFDTTIIHAEKAVELAMQ